MRQLAPPLAWENRTVPAPHQLPEKSGSCSSLGNTVELTLVAWGEGTSWPQGVSIGELAPATCLQCTGMVQGEMPPCFVPCHICQAGELALRLSESLTCHSTWNSRPCLDVMVAGMSAPRI